MLLIFMTTVYTLSLIHISGTFMNKENIPIYQLLNQWINETAPTLYPGYLFTDVYKRHSLHDANNVTEQITVNR